MKILLLSGKIVQMVAILGLMGIVMVGLLIYSLIEDNRHDS